MSDNYGAWTVAELKLELKKRNAKISGRKEAHSSGHSSQDLTFVHSHYRNPLKKKNMGRKDTFNVKQLRKAIKLSENPTFQRNFRKFSELFTRNRLNKIGNKSKRLYTEREKLMALSLYKKDSHAYYSLLSKMFVLPPQSELQKLTSKLYNKPGINKRICDKLKSKTMKLSRMEKMCVLLFDEVIIRPSFDQKRSVGIRDENSKNSQIADHAVIFMIRSIFKKTKQPIAYKFSFGKMTRNKLKISIENIILDLQACGFNILATVCDHNARNIGAITKLMEETQEKDLGMNEKKYPHRTFKVNSKEIVPLFDAPHLMKGLRNDLITRNLKCTLEGSERVAKWEHFVQFEKICATVFADLGWHCLSKRHVDPKKMDRIDPDIAIQTFYDKNGRFMGGMSGRSYNNDQDTIAAEAVDTAHITMFIDKLYKSMSGSYKERSQDEPLLARVNPTKQVHEKVWNNSKLVFTSMKFIADDGKEVSTNSIKAWIITLDNITYLSRVLYVKYHITQFWMARFNMDPLMILIRRLQKYGCRNITTFANK